MESDLKRTASLSADELLRVNDLAGQGILLTDSELIICGWNQWLEDHSGFKDHEVVGRNLLELYPCLVKRGLRRQYEWALEGQVRVLSQLLHGYLLPMRTATEVRGFSQMQQSARISPLTRDGEVVGTVTVIDDVTERVAREAELQAQIEFRSQVLAREQAARAEAEQANRLKDEFLATISHELRTPLNAIMGWSHLLLTGRLDQQTSDRAIKTIHRNAQAQNQLISDLLDVSRIVSGKLVLDRLPLDLSPIIAASLDAIRPAAEAKDISLTSVIDIQTGAILADADRLQQVIWNLLSNAVKFTPRGGRIEVSLSRIDNQLQMVVSDSGIGISPEFLPHVFDRFRQADAATTRTQGGLGLGLSIVRDIVELHDGTVSAASDGEDKGSSFILRLPFASDIALGVNSNNDDQDESEKYLPALKNLKILVVDDEVDTCELLRTLLEKCDCQVVTVTSAAAGLEAIKQGVPDVLISDIGMPVEDGYSLIARVRALPPDQGGKLPAVALTAYAASTDRQRLIRSGFQIHLTKPIQTVEFLATIASLAGNNLNPSDLAEAASRGSKTQF
jgi:PAS domain S-box-containing protein